LFYFSLGMSIIDDFCRVSKGARATSFVFSLFLRSACFSHPPLVCSLPSSSVDAHLFLLTLCFSLYGVFIRQRTVVVVPPSLPSRGIPFVRVMFQFVDSALASEYSFTFRAPSHLNRHPLPTVSRLLVTFSLSIHTFSSVLLVFSWFFR